MNKRSGNPGYQRGKPVLSGTLKKNETGLNWFIDREQEPFLKIMKTNVDCSTANPNDRYFLTGFYQGWVKIIVVLFCHVWNINQH
jgi:hypothetical protein